jgi:hypothetical protein
VPQAEDFDDPDPISPIGREPEPAGRPHGREDAG